MPRNSNTSFAAWQLPCSAISVSFLAMPVTLGHITATARFLTSPIFGPAFSFPSFRAPSPLLLVLLTLFLSSILTSHIEIVRPPFCGCAPLTHSRQDVLVCSVVSVAGSAKFLLPMPQPEGCETAFSPGRQPWVEAPYIRQARDPSRSVGARARNGNP